jgi:hypothetical protein
MKQTRRILPFNFKWVYGNVLKYTVKESNPSPMGNILQVAHNFNIISGCFSQHIIKITVSLRSFLPPANL